MHRADTLRKAADLTTGDRNKAYGHPYDNYSNTADLMNAYIIAKYRGTTVDENQFRLTPEDACHLMALVKMARTFHGKHHPDNYIDSACYEAMAGECRFIQENDGDYPAEVSK